MLANWDWQIFAGLPVIVFAFISQAHLLPIFSELKPKISEDPKQTLLMNTISVFVSGLMYMATGMFKMNSEAFPIVVM